MDRNAYQEDENALPHWGIHANNICDKITNRKSIFKILLKTKDEPEFLGGWIEYHSKIVGVENLIVADNESADPVVIETLKSLQRRGGVVFRFSGFHNFIHDHGRYPELFEAVRKSANFYFFMDSDERLVWIEEDRWFADERILERLVSKSACNFIPGVILDNFAETKDTFYFSGSDNDNSAALQWGKPIISSGLDIGPGDYIHNCQFPEKFLVNSHGNNVFTLHLSKLFPAQRLESNRKKLVARGVIPQGADIYTVADLAENKTSDDPVAIRCLSEIVAIMRYISSKTEFPWGPKDKNSSIYFRPNGTIEFLTVSQKDKFLEFVQADARVYLSPDRANFLEIAVKSYIASGDLLRAEDAIERGLQNFFSHLDEHGDPVFLKEKIRLALSQRDFTKAASLIPAPSGPGRFGWHNILFARAYELEQQFSKALEFWEAFAKTHPGHPEAEAALIRHAGTPKPLAPATPSGPLKPAMTEAECALFTSYLEKAKAVLEFGAGGSTALAGRLGVPHVVSVESDKAWLDMLAGQPDLKNVTFVPLHVDIGPTGAWGFPSDKATAASWPAYYSAVWSKLDRAPDLILVDGRFRVACALSCVLNAKPGTVIIVHDFWNRPEYHVILRYLICTDRVDTLGVFKAAQTVDWKSLAGDLISHALDPR